MENGAVPSFVKLVLTPELQTFINSKGVNLGPKVALGLLERIEAASVDREEWPRHLRDPSRFAGDDFELLKARHKKTTSSSGVQARVGWSRSNDKRRDAGEPRSIMKYHLEKLQAPCFRRKEY